MSKRSKKDAQQQMTSMMKMEEEKEIQ